MTAIVAAFREWEYMLRSMEEQRTVYTDHKNLEYKYYQNSQQKTALPG